MAVSGVVDENIDLAARRFDRRFDLFRRVRLRKIGFDDQSLCIEFFFEFCGELFEAIAPARCQNKIGAFFCKRISKSLANSGGCAGDQRAFSVVSQFRSSSSWHSRRREATCGKARAWRAETDRICHLVSPSSCH